MRKLKVVTAVLFCAFVLTGCYDDREIDETAYIIALGIDAADNSDTSENEGESGENRPKFETNVRNTSAESNEENFVFGSIRSKAPSSDVSVVYPTAAEGKSKVKPAAYRSEGGFALGYKYTFQFAAPLAVSGETGGTAEETGETDENSDAGNPSVRNVVITASDFYVAKNMLNNFLGKNIDMSHLKMIVFSPKVDREGYISHSQLFLHEREVRPHTSLAVAERSAEEFLCSVNPELELNTAKYYELMALRSNNVYAPMKTLRDFAGDSAGEGRDAVLPIARISNEKAASAGKARAGKEDSAWIDADGVRISSSRSSMRGMAVFRDSEPVGEMDGDDALVYNILTRGIKKCNVSLRNARNSEDSVSFAVGIPEAARFGIEEKNGGYTVTVKTRLIIKYINEVLPNGYQSYDELYEYACSEFEKKFSEFLYFSSRNFGADIFEIGKQVRRRYADTKSFNRAEPSDIYKTAEFDVVVEML